jgi:phage host-nuclease inhibitor protein Gam
MPTANQQATIPCPHCNQPVVISGNKLLKPGTASAKDAVAQAEKIKAAEESLASVKQEILRVNTELGHKKAAVDAANKAAGMLAGLQAGTKKPATAAATTDHGSTEDCRARVARSENRLAAWSRRANAASKHDAIGKNQQIIDILAPDGLRLSHLKQSLAIINTKLASIAAITGWLPVEIEDDMSISYGDYQYVLLSKSTQYRVRISLQATFVLLDGSPMLLIDGADILDSAGRNGLFKMLAQLPATAAAMGFQSSVVAMTIDKQEKIPAIEKLGGCAYWVENGSVIKVRG